MKPPGTSRATPGAGHRPRRSPLDTRPGASIALVAINAAGAGFFLHFARKTWPIPEEAGLCSQTFEPFIWVIFCLGSFLASVISNLVWWLVARPRRRRGDTRRRWPARVAVVLLWAAVLFIDDVHQRAWAENCPPEAAARLRGGILRPEE